MIANTFSHHHLLNRIAADQWFVSQVGHCSPSKVVCQEKGDEGLSKGQAGALSSQAAVLLQTVDCPQACASAKGKPDRLNDSAQDEAVVSFSLDTEKQADPASAMCSPMLHVSTAVAEEKTRGHSEGVPDLGLRQIRCALDFCGE